jgi:hypothetical protein
MRHTAQPAGHQCASSPSLPRSIHRTADPRLPIGEPATPPRIAPARGPPLWEEEDSGSICLDEELFTGDPLAHPEPSSRIRSARELVSRASAAAEFSVARIPRAAVSPGQKTVSRLVPPSGKSERAPHFAYTTFSKALTGGLGRRDI